MDSLFGLSNRWKIMLKQEFIDDMLQVFLGEIANLGKIKIQFCCCAQFTSRKAFVEVHKIFGNPIEVC